MTLTYDLYWSFRSPYSYMIMHRLTALERDYDVVCNVRPVYPLAVRTPEFFDTRDPLWFSYFMADIHREAQFLNLPDRSMALCRTSVLPIGNNEPDAGPMIRTTDNGPSQLSVAVGGVYV